MRPIQGIIFDAEGVIIQTEGLWDQSQREFFGRRGIQYDRTKSKHLLAGRSLIEGVKIIQEMYPIPGDPADLATERRTIMAELLLSNVDFVPGFLDYYRRAVHTGFATCVATSMEPALFDAVDERLRLRELFDGRIYFTADVGGLSKPDPAVFLYAARQIHCRATACLVIEDSPAGIAGAAAAGMQCVALTTTFPEEHLGEADLICESFANIPPAQLSNVNLDS